MKTKLLFSSFILIAFATVSYSQTNNGFAITYGKSIGTATYSFLKEGFLMGSSSSNLENNNTLGIRYFNKLKGKEKTKIEIGFNYLSGNLKISPAMTGDPVSDAPFFKDLILISAPVYLNHTLWDYFYLNYGLSLDYQKTKDSDTYSGFGLGIGFGIGGRYDYKNYFFYLNPKYERHLFMSESFGLLEFGIMMGIGYSF
jgi:hypothetical protein